MKRITAGVVAHVDAGKTTLSEALLYRCGAVRRLGRVDHGDAFLDTAGVEKERGITVFAHQTTVDHAGTRLTLLDTPGHVDFAAETERVLNVLDYAVLVVSGTDGVQGHTETLWRLLERYRVPVLLFVNKCDAAGFDREAALADLRARLSEAVTPLPGMDSDAAEDAVAPFGEDVEDVAVLDEEAMEEYLTHGGVTLGRVRRMVASRRLFPVWFGSALRLDGVDEFLDALALYTREPAWPEEFGARVFKISHDERHARLTWLRVTGGTLKAKSQLTVRGETEKIDQVRVYNGARHEIAMELPAGSVCAVTGLERTFPGCGLGMEEDAGSPSLQPVLTYSVMPDLPDEDGEHPRFDDLALHKAVAALRELEDEDPLLHVAWVERLRELHVQLMGEVQLEIVQRELRERFGLAVRFGAGSVLYRETITEPIEGVGHFEPLRHYAEAHILLEPGEPGSGVTVGTNVPENDLDRNWQRLVLTHLEEREHLGVLTGSPLTDVRMTLVAGRAHLKHTEGGDFRQAVYRAVRQGLMEARQGVKGRPAVGEDTAAPSYEPPEEPEEHGRGDTGAAGGEEVRDVDAMVKAVAADPGHCLLLEPWYRFRLEVPSDMVGRAMADIQRMSGDFDAPEDDGAHAVVEGHAPVSEMRDYAMDVNAYTHGRGRFSATFGGYRPCHDQSEVVRAVAYDPEGDLDHTPDSVFCAHGAGYPVKWYKVPEFAHVPYAAR